MSNGKVFAIAAFVGTTVGGFLPSLWGAGAFSMWGIVLSTVGGIIAVLFAYRVVT